MNLRRIATALVFLFIVAMFTSCPSVFNPGTVEAPVTPATDAYLTTLGVVVGGTPRDLSFVKTTMAYTVNVGTGITEVTVSATASSSSATIAGTGVLTLGAAGSTTVRNVVVTAADGTTTKTYTLTVKRATVGASSVSTLSALSVTLFGVAKTLTPAPFASGTLSYEVVGGFPNEASFMTINATATDSGADITGDGDRTMVVGANALHVQVTADDGVTMTTYTVNVERLNPESDKLSALSASGLGLAFSPNTRTYSLNAPNSLSSTTIAATPELSGSTIDISLNGGTSFNTFTSSAVVALAEGPNTITLRVNKEYSGDPGSSLYYTVSITRAASGASADASLSDLTLDGSFLAYSPVFASGTYSYTATVPSWDSSLSVTPTTTDAGAVAVVSGNNSLSYGANTITVSVTAADGTTQHTYTITVTRRSPPSLTIASPANGATVDISTSTTLTLSGSFTDTDGEVASIEYYFGSTFTAATVSGNTFSATIDLSGSTNGKKQIIVTAKDSADSILASAPVAVTITGGVTGHSISFYAVLPDGATQSDGYLMVEVYNAVDDTYPLFDMDLSGVTFPLHISAEGLTDASYTIEVWITDAPSVSATKNLFAGIMENVTVAGADVEAGSMYLLNVENM